MPLAEVITADLGAPLAFSRDEQVGTPIAVLASYVELLGSYNFGGDRVGNSLIVREPAGVAGGHHAVELPAVPDHQQDGRRAGRGLPDGAEDHRGRAAGRVRAGRASCTRPGCRPGCSTCVRDRARGRRGAGPAPGRGPGVVHRLDPGRDAGGGTGRGHGQEGPAGTRRQVGERGAARRGPGHRGRTRNGPGVRQLRPGLQRADQDARAGRAVRRGGGRWPWRRPGATRWATRWTRAPAWARWCPPSSATGSAATSSAGWPTGRGW